MGQAEGEQVLVCREFRPGLFEENRQSESCTMWDLKYELNYREEGGGSEAFTM